MFLKEFFLFSGLLPYCLPNSIPQMKRPTETSKPLFPPQFNPSSLTNLASFMGGNSIGSESRKNAIDPSSLFLNNSLPLNPNLMHRISNPFHPFTSGFPLYFRRDTSSPSDSSNNGVRKTHSSIL